MPTRERREATQGGGGGFSGLNSSASLTTLSSAVPPTTSTASGAAASNSNVIKDDAKEKVSYASKSFSETVSSVRGKTKSMIRSIEDSRTYLKGSKELEEFNVNFGLDLKVSSKDFSSSSSGAGNSSNYNADMQPNLKRNQPVFNKPKQTTKQISSDSTTLFFDEILANVLTDAEFPRRNRLSWKDENGDDESIHDNFEMPSIEEEMRSKKSIDREKVEIQKAILNAMKDMNFAESFKVSRTNQALVGKKKDAKVDLHNLNSVGSVVAPSDVEDKEDLGDMEPQNTSESSSSNFPIDTRNNTTSSSNNNNNNTYSNSNSFNSLNDNRSLSPKGNPSPILLLNRTSSSSAAADNLSGRPDSPSKTNHLLSPRSNFLANHIKIGLPSKHLIVLKNALYGNSDSLNLSYLKIDDSICKLLAKALLNAPPSISTINLSNNSMSDKGVATILESLLPNKSVTTLNLSNNTLGMKSIEVLQSLMNGSKCNIKILLLDGTSLDDFTLSRLLSSLYYNKTLEVLSISNNMVGKGFLYGSSVSNSLTNRAIKGDQSVLSNFSAAGNSSNICVANQFHEIFLLGNTPLKTLNMSNNILKAKNGEVLCRSLALSKYLTHLDVSNNSLSSSMGILLADCLFSMRIKSSFLPLKVVNLSNNLFDNLASFCLLISVQNYNLSHLDLSNNSIGFQGLLNLVRLAQYTTFKPIEIGSASAEEEKEREKEKEKNEQPKIDEYRDLKTKLGYDKLPKSAPPYQSATFVNLTRCDVSSKVYNPIATINTNNIVSNIGAANTSNTTLYKSFFENIAQAQGACSIVGSFQLELSDPAQRFFAIYLLQSTAVSNHSTIVHAEITGIGGGSASPAKAEKRGVVAASGLNLKRKYVLKTASSARVESNSRVSTPSNSSRPQTASTFTPSLQTKIASPIFDDLQMFKERLDSVLSQNSNKLQSFNELMDVLISHLHDKKVGGEGSGGGEGGEGGGIDKDNKGFNIAGFISKPSLIDILTELKANDLLRDKFNVVTSCITPNDSSLGQGQGVFDRHDVRNFLLYYYEVRMGQYFNSLYSIVYVDADAGDQSKEYIPPDSGSLLITTREAAYIEESTWLPFSEKEVKNDPGLEAFIDQSLYVKRIGQVLNPDMCHWLNDHVASNPSDAVLIVETIIANYNFYLFEAISIIEGLNHVLYADNVKNEVNKVQLYVSAKLLPFIAKIIPKLVHEKDAYYLVKYFSQFELIFSRELKSKMGILFNPLIYGSYTGYYHLNLAKENDRTCLYYLINRSYGNKIIRTKCKFAEHAIDEKIVESRVEVTEDDPSSSSFSLSLPDKKADAMTVHESSEDKQFGDIEEPYSDKEKEGEVEVAEKPAPPVKTYELKINVEETKTSSLHLTPLFDISGNGDFTCFRNVRLNGEIIPFFDYNIYYPAMKSGTLEFDFADSRRLASFGSVTKMNSTSINYEGQVTSKSSKRYFSTFSEFPSSSNYNASRSPVNLTTLFPDYKIDYFISKYLLDPLGDPLSSIAPSLSQSPTNEKGLAASSSSSSGSDEQSPSPSLSLIQASSTATSSQTTSPALLANMNKEVNLSSGLDLVTIDPLLAAAKTMPNYYPIDKAFPEDYRPFIRSKDQVTQIFDYCVKMETDLNRKGNRKIQLLYSCMRETGSKVTNVKKRDEDPDSDEDIDNAIQEYKSNNNVFLSWAKPVELDQARLKTKETGSRDMVAKMKKQETDNKKKGVLNSLRKAGEGQSKLAMSHSEIFSNIELYFSGVIKDTNAIISRRCDTTIDIFLLFVGCNHISCRQLIKVLSNFMIGRHQKTRFGSYRVELICIIFTRIVDICNLSDVLAVLTAKEIAALQFRLGHLYILNPLKLDGCYKLDLSKWEQRENAKILINSIRAASHWRKDSKLYSDEAFYNAVLKIDPLPSSDSASPTAVTSATATTATSANATGAAAAAAATSSFANTLDAAGQSYNYEPVAYWALDPKLWSSDDPKTGLPKAGVFETTITDEPCGDNLEEMKNRFSLFSLVLASPLELNAMLDNDCLLNYFNNKCDSLDEEGRPMSPNSIRQSLNLRKETVVANSYFSNPDLLGSISVSKNNDSLSKLGISWSYSSAHNPLEIPIHSRPNTGSGSPEGGKNKSGRNSSEDF